MIVEKSRDLFSEIIDFHSQNRPPYSYEIYSPDDKIQIMNYFDNTFYRNYSLYENIYKYNTNIYLGTVDFPAIPSKDLPKMEELSNSFSFADPSAIEYLRKNYINVEKKKKKVKKEVSKEERQKTEYELYEDVQLEMLRSNQSQFYKSNRQLEQKVILETDEQTKFEINQTKQFMTEKINEILKEANENMQLYNKNIAASISKLTAPATVTGKKE